MRSCQTFDSAYAELLAALWAELEAMLELHGPGMEDRVEARERWALRTEIMLLELALLWDKCESLRVRKLIDHEQASTMRALIAELRAHLDLASTVLTSRQARSAITSAQNLLFDEVQRIGLEDQPAMPLRMS